MLWFLVFVVVIAAVWVFRAQILARVLGQPESRVRRQITHKKDGRP